MDQLHRMETKIDRIERALMGDDKMKQKGMVHKLDDLEKSHSKLKTDYHKHKNLFVLVSSGISALFGSVISFFGKKIFE
mgnify:FL=1